MKSDAQNAWRYHELCIAFGIKGRLVNIRVKDTASLGLFFQVRYRTHMLCPKYQSP